MNTCNTLNKENTIWQLPAQAAFIGIAASLTVTFASSAMPIPLYEIYRTTIGLTKLDLALTAVAYFAGAITALLFLGRLSDYLGRRIVTIISLSLGIISCLFFVSVDSSFSLIFGRFVQGLSCGIASSAITSYVIDCAPKNPAWLGATVASGAPLVGLSVGAIGAGTLVEYNLAGQQMIYWFAIISLFVCITAIYFSPETVVRKKFAFSSLRPQIKTPKAARPLLLTASSTFIATWALGGFYQAYGSSITAEQLGTKNTLIAALVFSSYMIGNPIGGMLGVKLNEVKSQRYGIVAFVFALLILLSPLKLGLLAAFIFASILAGIAQGVTFTGSLRRLLAVTSQHERAGMLAAIYMISYCGAAVPNWISGYLSQWLNLFELACGYAILACTACLIVIFVLGHMQTQSNDRLN